MHKEREKNKENLYFEFLVKLYTGPLRMKIKFVVQLSV